MEKRGPKPRRAQINWSHEIAYAVGLLATDGCLSSDGRHIDLTSKDLEQLENLSRCLDIKTSISYKKSGYTGKLTPRLQFSDVTLYHFLQEIGFTPAKTKTIGSIAIPEEFLFDFIRGSHDGDGSFFSYWDKRWRSSFMYYLIFNSASQTHINWIQQRLFVSLSVKGHCTKPIKNTYQLRYAKRESLMILKKMYYDPQAICLSRKRLKIKKALSIVGEHF